MSHWIGYFVLLCVCVCLCLHRQWWWIFQNEKRMEGSMFRVQCFHNQMFKMRAKNRKKHKQTKRKKERHQELILNAICLHRPCDKRIAEYRPEYSYRSHFKMIHEIVILFLQFRMSYKFRLRSAIRVQYICFGFVK